MKKLILYSIVAASIVFTTNDSFAQRGRGGRGTSGGGTTGGSNTGGATGTKTTTNPTTNTNTSATGGTGTTIKTDVKPKKIFDTANFEESTGKEYGVDVKKSRRTNFGYQPEPTSDRKPLAWDHIREDDATYSQFVWRDIDGREKVNLPFIYNAKEEAGDQRFFSILLDAIKHDNVIAFSNDDDRFTTPLTTNEVLSLSSAKSKILDTSYQPNIDNEDIKDTVIFWKRNDRAPKPDSVYKFRIKEQWMFDKESSRMLVRIIAIAPLAPIQDRGTTKKASNEPPKYYPLFWVYYPDLRASLAKHFAYNPKNMGARMTWEEVFEGRFFSSAIYKSTLNNPGDKTLAQLIKDPLFQLLEGENIKEKLFNYEQDLWSY